MSAAVASVQPAARSSWPIAWAFRWYEDSYGRPQLRVFVRYYDVTETPRTCSLRVDFDDHQLDLQQPGVGKQSMQTDAIDELRADLTRHYEGEATSYQVDNWSEVLS